MLAIKNLSRSFGDIKAVQNISFTADKGEIVGFLGPNGAGKTTTLRMMVGYLQPDSGTIELDGENVFDNPLAASARIGYLPELNPLYNEMTVEEFLRFIAALRKMKEPYLSERLEFVRENCGLDEVWKQKIGTLSKGYRQRTGLAQAIIHNPDLLILDEPTSGLDPNQILEIRELIRELGENKTVILSSHIMQEVQALCSRVIIIHKGQIIVDDSIENLSSYISETTQIVLELEAENPDFQPWLEQYPQVQLTDIEPKDDHLAFKFTIPIEMDLRKELSAFVSEQGWYLISMYRETQSLEEIFHLLTSEEPFYTEEEEKEEEEEVIEGEEISSEEVNESEAEPEEETISLKETEEKAQEESSPKEQK